MLNNLGKKAGFGTKYPEIFTVTEMMSLVFIFQFNSVRHVGDCPLVKKDSDIVCAEMSLQPCYDDVSTASYGVGAVLQ